jgi:acetyl-CoA acetyltransferase
MVIHRKDSTMTTQETGWRRDKEGLGLWPHQGKVAITGWGMSPVDRRWDGISMNKTLGAYAILASQLALEDAGVKPEEVDGLLCCEENMAGAVGGGSSAIWAPRPYFDSPYDSEDGLTVVSGEWMLKNMNLPNVKYAPEHVPAIGEQMGMAAQAVADGMCDVALVVYTANNLEGRYRQGGENEDDYVGGNRQWSAPWGSHGGLMYSTNIPLHEYCAKYGTTWEELLGPFVVNQHRNGLMNEWGFYSLHGASGLTYEDYVNSRPIIYPLRLWDCDRPVNAVGAFVFASAERAKDMRHKPVYVLNHNQGSGGAARSTQEVLEDTEEAKARVARMVYEGSGLSPRDVDIFNPYDGYSTFMPTTLEAFEWHGVKKGDAADFLKGDISVEGPHPFCSGGGNLGNGRTRTAMYIDSIEQLRGTAGRRQVTVKAETAICAFAPGNSAAYLCLSSSAP